MSNSVHLRQAPAVVGLGVDLNAVERVGRLHQAERAAHLVLVADDRARGADDAAEHGLLEQVEARLGAEDLLLELVDVLLERAQANGVGARVGGAAGRRASPGAGGAPARSGRRAAGAAPPERRRGAAGGRRRGRGAASAPGSRGARQQTAARPTPQRARDPHAKERSAAMSCRNSVGVEGAYG